MKCDWQIFFYLQFSVFDVKFKEVKNKSRNMNQDFCSTKLWLLRCLFPNLLSCFLQWVGKSCLLQTGITYHTLSWPTTGLQLGRWRLPRVDSIRTLKENISTVSVNVMGEFFSWLYLAELSECHSRALCPCQIMRSPDSSDKVIQSDSMNVMHHRYLVMYYRHLKIH